MRESEREGEGEGEIARSKVTIDGMISLLPIIEIVYLVHGIYGGLSSYVFQR